MPSGREEKGGDMLKLIYARYCASGGVCPEEKEDSQACLSDRQARTSGAAAV